MEEIRIQCARDADAQALATVYRNAYRENRALGFPAKAENATAEQVAEWIADHEVLVAHRDGERIGAVRLEATDPDRMKVSRLAVQEHWKGMGVGSLLLAHAEEHAMNGGYDRIWLTTPREHPYLPDFYRDRGYEQTGTYSLDYREYDEIILEKDLRDGQA